MALSQRTKKMNQIILVFTIGVIILGIYKLSLPMVKAMSMKFPINIEGSPEVPKGIFALNFWTMSLLFLTMISILLYLCMYMLIGGQA